MIEIGILFVLLNLSLWKQKFAEKVLVSLSLTTEIS